MAKTNKISTGPRRAIGYVRISKNRESETSTTTQEERVRAWCAAQGSVLVDVIVEPGRSAFKESRNGRPGLRRALGMIEAGAANELVVWKIDRCSRNALDLLTLVRDLQDKGAAFASVTESFDTRTAIGRTMLQIIAALAELESATKSERTQAWVDHRRTSAVAPAARPPRGYCKPDPNTLQIDPVEGPLMTEALEQLLAGASLRSTVRWLRAAGLSITHTGLAKVCASPTIAGLIDIGDGTLIEGDWKPLIERERWEQLRDVLADPQRRTNGSGTQRRFALAGIARCGRCGGVMRGKNHTSAGPRLQCVDCTCGIRYADVEQLVADVVLDRLDDATWRSLRERGRGPEVIVEVIEAKIAGLMQMMAANELDVDEFRMIKLGLEGQLAASTAPPLTLPDVDGVRAAWPALSVDQRRLVYLAVIERLEIGPAAIGARRVDTDRITLDLID